MRLKYYQSEDEGGFAGGIPPDVISGLGFVQQNAYAWFNEIQFSNMNHGDKLETWIDHIGGRHATQSTEADKPTINNLGWRTGTGIKSLAFDGTSQFYPMTSDFLTSASASAVAILCKSDGIYNRSVIRNQLTSGSGVNPIRSSSAYHNLDWMAGTGNTEPSTSPWVTYDPFGIKIVVITNDSVDVTGYIDHGVGLNQYDTQSVATFGADIYGKIGCAGSTTPNTFWDGYIKEIIYFDEVPSAINIGLVGSYLSWTSQQDDFLNSYYSENGIIQDENGTPLTDESGNYIYIE